MLLLVPSKYFTLKTISLSLRSGTALSNRPTEVHVYPTSDFSSYLFIYLFLKTLLENSRF